MWSSLVTVSSQLGWEAQKPSESSVCRVIRGPHWTWNLTEQRSSDIVIIHLQSKYLKNDIRQRGYRSCYPANIPTRYWLTPSGVRLPTSEKTREMRSGLYEGIGIGTQKRDNQSPPGIVYVRIILWDVFLCYPYRCLNGLFRRILGCDSWRVLRIGSGW